jgi:hypothetical protein
VFDGDGTFKREIKIDAVRRERQARDRHKPDLTTYLQTGGSRTWRTLGAVHHARAEPSAAQSILSAASTSSAWTARLAISVSRANSSSSSDGSQMACPSENELYVAEIRLARAEVDPAAGPTKAQVEQR